MTAEVRIALKVRRLVTHWVFLPAAAPSWGGLSGRHLVETIGWSNWTLTCLRSVHPVPEATVTLKFNKLKRYLALFKYLCVFRR